MGRASCLLSLRDRKPCSIEPAWGAPETCIAPTRCRQGGKCYLRCESDGPPEVFAFAVNARSSNTSCQRCSSVKRFLKAGMGRVPPVILSEYSPSLGGFTVP